VLRFLPLWGTFDHRKFLILFTSPRNRTQEADGSIPFSSAILLVFSEIAGRQSFPAIQEAVNRVTHLARANRSPIQALLRMPRGGHL
jgi:hypothetical protein